MSEVSMAMRDRLQSVPAHWKRWKCGSSGPGASLLQVRPVMVSCQVCSPELP